jgi:hypothetical protein
LNRRVFTAGGLASLAAATGLQPATAQESTPSTDRPVINQIPDPVALGVMVEIVQDPSKLDALVAQIGREPAIVMFHMHWGNESGNFNRPLLDFLDERGVTPLITWEAWRPLYAGGVAVADQPDFALRFILDGSFDSYIETWAQGIAAFGKPVLLRFGHEMNGDWYPWAVGVNGNSPQDFIDAWRYLHAKFAEAGATNVRWVWTPIVTGSTAIDEAFPGDDYVDFVGMSGFNWGTTQQAWGVGTWESFATIFTPMYESLQELSTKPIIIAEMACAEQGGSKADWIVNALVTELPTNFPEVRAVVWFNIIKETDWRIDSSPESLRAFVTAANSEYLSGTLPLDALA